MPFSIEGLNIEIAYLWVKWWQTSDPDDAEGIKSLICDLQKLSL